MKKIRIAFVETNCKKNGPIKQTLSVIRYMNRDIFEPALITVWPEEPENSMLDEYRNLNIPMFCCNLSKKSSIILGKKKVGKFLTQYNADIVQGVGIPPYRMTLGYKNAVHLVTLRNYCYEDYPDQYTKGIGTLMAFADMQLIRCKLRNGEPFVTCSKSLTDIYSSKENMDIPFIRNGVDINQYRKRSSERIIFLREKLDLPQNKLLFVYSGSLIDRKNQGEAIEAFLEMEHREDAVLLLLGDGKNRGKLEDKYGVYDNVIFRGKVSNVEDFLHACDVYVSTSKSEGLPNGVLEAMACGLPVILSDIPQHMEILNVDKSCGHSYHLGNEEELTKIFDYILTENLQEMGDKSYTTVINNFSAQGMSRQYQDLYLKLLKKDNEFKDDSL